MAARASLKIIKKSVADLACDQLREAIVSGDLRPGARLVESVLAEEIGASKSTIRASLAALQGEGLVECRRYSAWSVAELDERLLWDIYGMRAALESAAARILAEGIREEDVAAVRKAEETLEKAEQKQSAKLRCDADLAFHRLIVERCGNRLIVQHYETIATKIRWVYAVSESRTPARINLVHWHQPLADAICAGDGPRAAQLAFELCMKSLDDDVRDLELPAPAKVQAKPKPKMVSAGGQ